MDLLNSDERNVQERDGPAIVHARVAARRRGRVARRHRAVERHVVFLVRVHGEVVGRTDGAEVQRRAQPGVLRRVEELPRDLQIGILRVTADVGTHAQELLAVGVDPAIARRMLRLARDVGGVVNAVEVDRLAVVVLPFAVGRRGEADHRGGRGPHVHVRHHFMEDLPGRNLARRPHDARHAEGRLRSPCLFHRGTGWCRRRARRPARRRCPPCG